MNLLLSKKTDILNRLIITIVLSITFLGIGNAQIGVSSDTVFHKFLTEYGIPITDNNEAILLPSGEKKFIDLFEKIKSAKHHIHLEYFNFRNDSIANALFSILTAKVEEGVEVRALFDAFGNWSNNKPLKKKHLKDLRKRGIEIVKFDPFRFPYINHAMHRDHRKIVVIDGKVGYTGGMNIADYYIHGTEQVGNWYDMHMRIEGSAVKYLQEIFLNTWNKETKQHIGGPQYYPDPKFVDEEKKKTLAIVDRWPKRTPKAMRDAYKEAILSAENHIRIINPYFVPTSSIRKVIRTALKRGVKVDIMIPLISDIPLTPDAAFYIAHTLYRKGANIYLFNDGFHHTKIMTVDDRFCTVGSTNLNSRSLRYDYETNAFIFDEEITHQLDSLFISDTDRSIKFTDESWEERSNWRKFVGWFGNLLTPFL